MSGNQKLSFARGDGKIVPFIPCQNTPKVYEKGRDLKLVIRTDASFSTKRLKQHLCSSLGDSNSANFNFVVADINGSVGQEAYVQRLVHSAYENWGHSMLKTIVNHTDYEAYGVDETKSRVVEIEFFNAKDIASNTVKLGEEFIYFGRSSSQVTLTADNTLEADDVRFCDLPDFKIARDTTFYITFDEMIPRPETVPEAQWGELGFSRLFSMDGRERYDYVGRPGKGSIDEQIEIIKDRLKALYEQEGKKAQIVLLEDNVRHARMINWAIEQMDEHGAFEYADISALSTCFCCASEEERQKITFKGNSVPVLPVADYYGEIVDVITPRDLMFDGIVVELEGQHTRLPALFMDLEQRMGIKGDKQVQFVKDVINANVLFCDTIRNAFDFEPPVSWFIHPDAIEHVTGLSGDMPMKEFMHQVEACLPLTGNSLQKAVERHMRVS